MRDFPLSASQIAAAAGVTFAEAQVACYMASASDRSIADFCERGWMARRDAREWAHLWGIVFPDYNPFAKPKRLEWRKAKKGWELRDGEEVIGDCLRTSEGKYCARTFTATSVDNWDRRRAMAALSAELDAQSPDLPGFGGKPVETVETTEHGLVIEVIFPVEDDRVKKCRDALQFRTMAMAA